MDLIDPSVGAPVPVPGAPKQRRCLQWRVKLSWRHGGVSVGADDSVGAVLVLVLAMWW